MISDLANSSKQLIVKNKFMLRPTDKCLVFCEAISTTGALKNHIMLTSIRNDVGTVYHTVDLGNGWGDFLITLQVVIFCDFV